MEQNYVTDTLCICFSNKIYGSNFIKQHSETVTVSNYQNYQNADCSLTKELRVIYYRDCQSYFAIDLPSCDLIRRQAKFILRYISTVNGFCQFYNKL